MYLHLNFPSHQPSAPMRRRIFNLKGIWRSNIIGGIISSNQVSCSGDENASGVWRREFLGLFFWFSLRSIELIVPIALFPRICLAERRFICRTAYLVLELLPKRRKVYFMMGRPGKRDSKPQPSNPVSRCLSR